MIISGLDNAPAPVMILDATLTIDSVGALNLKAKYDIRNNNTSEFSGQGLAKLNTDGSFEAPLEDCDNVFFS